ncbi:MAG: hypothetical protein C0475_04775 [Planctomyces sp.]|nr:hypothetical protein [Planctomyces sp.]
MLDLAGGTASQSQGRGGAQPAGAVGPERPPAGNGAGQAGLRAKPGAGARGDGGVSIRTYLTDGSVARLCDEMTRLTGVPIWLRDSDGRGIIPAEAPALWRSVPGEEAAARAWELLGRAKGVGAELMAVPLRTSVGELGALVLPADWGRDDPTERRALERAVTLLAATAAESVEGQISLSRRVHELDALLRLSSLLVAAGDSGRVLQAALDMALEVLGLEAGSISLMDELSGQVLHRAVRNLSDQWLASMAPLSIDQMLKARALAGEVVVVEDLPNDQRLPDLELVRREGLTSLMATGLVYQGRAMGMIRLYSRRPRVFERSEMDLLKAIAEHAAMVTALQRLRELREQDAAIARQLRLAADVQGRMMPRVLPQSPALDIAAHYRPSYELGGDLYDVFEKHGMGGPIGLVVGDVVGKGVPAALLMSAVRASLRAFIGEEWRLDHVMHKTNLAVRRDTLESEFVTVWCGVIDPKTLELAYCSAGHDPALLLRPRGGGEPEVMELGTDGMALGVSEAERYEVRTCVLRPGDLVLLHTDGLSEAMDYQNRKFGRARVVRVAAQLLRDRPGATSREVIERLMWELRQFAGLRASDDVTIVALRATAGGQAC